MIHNGNRLIVQDGKGETDMKVLVALAIAGFESAPRGLDLGNLFDAGKKLTSEDVADLDLIKFSPGRIDLAMDGDVFGRDCSLFATQDADGVYVVNSGIVDVWVEDLIVRSKEILLDLIEHDRRIPVEATASHVQ
jgi:hypothetical protein